MLFVAVVGVAVLVILISRGQDVSQALRWSLVCVIGGLMGYNLYAFGWLGTLRVSRHSRQWGAVLVTILGCVLAVGLLAAGRVAWKKVQERSANSVQDGPK
jgi:Flp pilus assembly protein protease CpaA